MAEHGDNKVVSIAMKLETVLAALIIVAVLISGIHVLKSMYGIFFLETAETSYVIFEKYLSHVLLLVIGLELSMMLVQHNPGSVIEVMLFAVARKMLIYSHTNIDMVIGTLALIGIFFIRKYLFIDELDCPDCRIMTTTPVGKKEAETAGSH
jgi:hypothetical protein